MLRVYLAKLELVQSELERVVVLRQFRPLRFGPPEEQSISAAQKSESSGGGGSRDMEDMNSSYGDRARGCYRQRQREGTMVTIEAYCRANCMRRCRRSWMIAESCSNGSRMLSGISVPDS